MFTRGFKVLSTNSAARPEAAVQPGAGTGRLSRPILRLPTAGLVAGTLVETDAGWQPVESLAIGQPVQTWDGGLQPLVRLERRRIAPGAGLVAVPGGVLSTCSDLLLLPDQHVLVETGAAAMLLDQDVALVPAAALLGWQGVTVERPRRGIDIIGLAFETEEAVYANTGALVHCAAAGAPAREVPRSEFFTVLDRDGARALLGFAPAPLDPAPVVPAAFAQAGTVRSALVRAA